MLAGTGTRAPGGLHRVGGIRVYICQSRGRRREAPVECGRQATSRQAIAGARGAGGGGTAAQGQGGGGGGGAWRVLRLRPWRAYGRVSRFSMNAYDAAIASAYNNRITNLSLDHYKFPKVAAASLNTGRITVENAAI